MPSSDIKGGIV